MDDYRVFLKVLGDVSAVVVVIVGIYMCYVELK